MSDLQLWDTAAVVNNSDTNGGNWLRLTPDIENNPNGTNGGAWTVDKWPTSAGFVSQFTFKITYSSSPANGFCFCVQNNSSTYWAGANGPSANAASVKFSTYQTTGDASYSCVTIEANGAALTSVDLLPVHLYDGYPHLARITYARRKDVGLC